MGEAVDDFPDSLVCLSHPEAMLHNSECSSYSEEALLGQEKSHLPLKFPFLECFLPILRPLLFHSTSGIKSKSSENKRMFALY